MTHPRFHILSTILYLSAAALSTAAPADNLVERLLDRIVENEQAFLTRMQEYSPVLETYIQEVVEDRQIERALRPRPLYDWETRYRR